MIITLCGSARFESWFHAWNEALTVAGHTVFSLACFPSVKGSKSWYSDEQKTALDKAHLRKIGASKAVLILNVAAYIGDSTLREFNHAVATKKRVSFLESWGEGLGISPSHTKEHRARYAELFTTVGGVTFPASPIDTFSYPSVWDLLGEAGSTERALALQALPQEFR